MLPFFYGINMVFLIAALHALPPLIGAWLFGEKGWVYGIIAGVICAIIFGAFVFTIPDLLGVGAGAFIGYVIISDRQLANKEAPDIKKQIKANVKELGKASTEFTKDLVSVDKDEPKVLGRIEQIFRIFGFILILIVLLAWITS